MSADPAGTPEKSTTTSARSAGPSRSPPSAPIWMIAGPAVVGSGTPHSRPSVGQVVGQQGLPFSRGRPVTLSKPAETMFPVTSPPPPNWLAVLQTPRGGPPVLGKQPGGEALPPLQMQLWSRGPA